MWKTVVKPTIECVGGGRSDASPTFNPPFCSEAESKEKPGEWDPQSTKLTRGPPELVKHFCL
jgi:hypothetical protein